MFPELKAHDCRVGKVEAILPTLAADSFDGCLTDPPYGLSFMGKSWDHGVPAAGVWREVLRVLKPGAFMLAFGGTRTFHRLTCAIEDAGFEIRDCLMWLYGSGFPKSKSCLKPAWEPIILAKKRGPAALAIDQCRIGTSDTRGKASRSAFGLLNDDAWNPREVLAGSECGRWPANLLLDESAAEALDEQSGLSNSTIHYRGKMNSGQLAGVAGSRPNPKDITASVRGVTDAGGASRFFYVAKASTRERGEGNTHPTVKPQRLTAELARYLLTLIKPPDAETRLLVPYAGSGSEMIGARAAGWGYVLGIEQSTEYAEIAERRLA